MYTFSGHTVRCVDGDTVVILLRQVISWPDETITADRSYVVRVLTVDAPETRGDTREAGLAATAYTRSVLFDEGDLAYPWALTLETEGKRDKYGRLLGTLRLADGPNMGRSLADLLVESGHGVYRDYAAHMAELMGEVA